ncbi:AIM24 family protein [Fodinicola feengrottensis]|uniref:AIM24 family protein n=1 Tax=Fodinicola feengrottensis TaxID=435914 RepID=UPI002441F406|nr:AIM24 family protein [Fodinicola feengrottensis]
MKCHGSGTVYLANQAQDVHILNLTGDGFTVDGKNVLAFAPELDWDIVRIDTGGPQIAGAGGFNIEMTGTGQVAVTTTGAPLVMKVTSQNYYFADADAVIGWSSSLQVSMQAAVTTSSVWKPRGNTGESWQMQFAGEGYVVVQPCELLPPYTTRWRPAAWASGSASVRARPRAARPATSSAARAVPAADLAAARVRAACWAALAACWAADKGL